VQSVVLIGERLVTGTKVNNTEPRVPEYDFSSGRLPGMRGIGPPVTQNFQSPVDCIERRSYCLTVRSQNSAHRSLSLYPIS